MRLTAHEALHLLFLVLGFHLAVDLAQPEFGEHLAKHLKSIFQVLEVDLLALFYQREHHIYLSAKPHLLADALVEAGELGVEDVLGMDWFASGWQFVDDTHVEVAIEGHGESAGNRGGGHHEHMGRSGALAP